MKVGVIMGGISSEREISIQSGNAVVNALDKDKYEAIPIVLNEKEDLIKKVKGIDFALLALHGKFGEDGTVQSVLKTLGIPFSGCGSLSSAICMDKDMTKRILAFGNVRTARWTMVNSVEGINYDEIENLGYPVFIKPNNGGSSVATTLVEKKEDVENAVSEALKYDTEVMIEEYIKGDEITCPIINGRMLPVIAIKPKGKFFDIESKYADGGADEFIVNLNGDLHKEVEFMALETYRLLKCDVYARVDMLIRDNVPYILEVNTLPGMTKNSLFPKSAAGDGMSFENLLDTIIEKSLKVNRE
ncbi:D-alanine--D-alanine ligase [Clostridium sp.]|uniref:D-alanine--D-alanine ligase n=1 Tax=Clostridium sp. TaxID=1506 RepID=UPI002611675F|nr:D-alanine--D-alanine ligase [Clostridium sp.]